MTITYLHDVAHQHRLELKDLLSLHLEDVNHLCQLLLVLLVS